MTQFSNGYALLIATNENAIANYALPDVAKDIAAVEAVLKHEERCAYDPAHIKVLMGKDATRQGIVDGLDWLEEQIQKDASGNATALVYYSGHGWRDEDASPPAYYLIPYDMRPGPILPRALRAEDFAAAVSALTPRRLLVILDCCHSGGMGVKEVKPIVSGFAPAAIPATLFMSGAKGTVPAEGAKGLEALSLGAGRAVLSSSQGEQPSYIRKDRKMSIFTYHLIEALTGHARPAEGATEVLVSDVMGHVWRRVPESARQDWGVDQQPDYQVSGNFPVALLLGGKGLTKGMAAPDPLAPLAATGLTTAFNQHEQTVHGPQTNIAGDVHGPVLSGQFGGPVAVGGGEAVDTRGSQGAVYKPSGPVEQQFGNRISITGDGNVIGRESSSRVIKTGGGAHVGGNVDTGSGDFVGRDEVVRGDQVMGDKVMGDKVGGDKITVGDVQGTGIAIGRDAQAQIQQGISAAELDKLFAPLVDLVHDLPSDKREPAEQKVQELKQEATKGKAADDSRLAHLIDGLVSLVPAAVSTVVGMFATPILGGLVGPVTKFVLDRFRQGQK